MADENMPQFGWPVQLSELRGLAQSGIYFLWDEGVIVYVGQAQSILARLSRHFAEGTKRFDAITYLHCPGKGLTSRERHFIEMLVPKYNACPLAKAMRVSQGKHLDIYREWASDELREPKRKRKARHRTLKAA